MIEEDIDFPYNGALPLSSQNPETPFKAGTLFLRTRMYVSLKELNQEVREESQRQRAKRKVKEGQIAAFYALRYNLNMPLVATKER